MAGAWRERLVKRVAESQLKNIILASERDLRPGLTVTTAAAYLFSALVLVTPFALLVLGSWVLWITDASIGGIFISLACLAAFWVLLPRVNRIGQEVYSREEMPWLFGLADQIADHMGARRVDGIVLEPGLNAFIGQFGRRRERILGIGLALWQLMEPEERIAVLCHEFAHELNADPARGLLVGGAEETLDGWVGLFTPDGRVDADEYGSGAFEAITVIVMRVIAWFIGLFQHALFLLHMRISQRAEYFADLLAAKAAGAAPMQTSLAKLMHRRVIRTEILRGWASEDAGRKLMLGLPGILSRADPDQIARSNKEAKSEKSSVDDTHPPTVFRIAFLEHHAELTGTFDNSTIDWSPIDEELDPFLESYGHALLHHRELL